jgi:hypothetical protein
MYTTTPTSYFNKEHSDHLVEGYPIYSSQEKALKEVNHKNNMFYHHCPPHRYMSPHMLLGGVAGILHYFQAIHQRNYIIDKDDVTEYVGGLWMTKEQLEIILKMKRYTKPNMDLHAYYELTWNRVVAHYPEEAPYRIVQMVMHSEEEEQTNLISEKRSITIN